MNKTIRKNRQTGTMISAYRDDFLGWITMCEEHGGYAEHATKSVAMSWMTEPKVWCQGCQAQEESN